jgi:hypothetical protein
MLPFVALQVNKKNSTRKNRWSFFKNYLILVILGAQRLSVLAKQLGLNLKFEKSFFKLNSQEQLK